METKQTDINIDDLLQQLVQQQEEIVQQRETINTLLEAVRTLVDIGKRMQKKAQR